jgi:hypothetical protein
LYVKLRDDPSVISHAMLEAQQLPVAADEVARAPARHAAAHDADGSVAGHDANGSVDNAAASSAPSDQAKDP